MDKAELAQMEKQEQNYWWHIGRRQILRDFLNRRLAGRDHKILDIGCGTGINFTWLKDFGQVTGSDTSSVALDYCRAHGAYHQLFQGDVPPGQFQLITAFDVLEHIEDDRAALTAWHRALSPDGHLLLTVPANPLLFSAHDRALHHFRRYTSLGLRRKLTQAGFRVEFISPFFFFTFPVVAIVRLLHKSARPKTTYEQVSTQTGTSSMLIGLSRVESAIISAGLGWPWGSSLLAYAVKK